MHRRAFMLLTCAAASLMAVGPSAARPQISTDAAQGVNFAAYKTFAWASAAAPSGMNPVAFDRIRTNIESAMAGKGYQKAAGDSGDVSLILTVGAKEKTQVDSFGRFGLQTDVYQYTQGTLSLDAFDTMTKKPIWHGQATETVNPGKTNNKALDDGVTKLMAKFPAGGGAAPAAPATRP
jgi:hypothetical protein